MKTKKKAVLSVIALALTFILFIVTAIFGISKTGTGSAKNISLGLDLSGGVSITYQAKEDNPSSEDMGDTIYKLQQRVDGYSTEAHVYQEGNNRINVEIPGVTDANKILEELGKPGTLEFQLEDGTVILDGTHVVSAEAAATTSDTNTSEYVVNLEFDAEGTKAFATATSENVGNSIMIVYNGETISAPVVQEAITAGRCEINGMSDMEEAKNLASSIRIGSLTLELEEIKSNVVGAQLGTNAIRTSVIAGIIGLLLVIVLMTALFKVPGIVAAFALILYTAMDLVCLNAFDLTLTLPGIAGIILSIGMAIDANVIIYTRIKEEITKGINVGNAIDNGYKKAFSAVFDGNITTLIAAFILNWLGSGSVKGFAQTLAIGIVLSMFTALVITKILLKSLYELGVKDKKYYGQIKKKEPINFVAAKSVYLMIAVMFIAIGPVTMAINSALGNGALNFSMDFKGGTATTITMDKDYTMEELDKDLTPLFSNVTNDAEVQIQKIAGSNDISVKTRTLDLKERESINTALKEKYELDDTDIIYETISSIISNEMRKDAVMAVCIATICILIYIWIRFKNLNFAASAVIALIHDVLIVLTCYSAMRISVGSTFIACMLTIVGYSINATIVIFDRIRENQNKIKDEKELVNTSITQTLSRSIYTSLTTFIMVMVLYIFGVSTIKEFAMPIMVGVVAGTFSSVGITGNIWYMLQKRKSPKGL